MNLQIVNSTKLRIVFACIAILIIKSLQAQIVPDDIEIIRDEWGVPHIYAPTDAGVAYGLAWAHAEDDFEDIQLTMTAAKMMLGRHLGKDGAAADFMVGLLRCEDIVERHYDQLSPEYKKVIAGYVEGINAYAKIHPKEVLVKQAFPITVKEALRGYLLQLAVMDGAGRVVSALLDEESESLNEVNGSNAFAVAPSRTESGETFLAVNSHQPYEGPAAWYEAHLVSDEGWNMLGGLFPGGATVFHGTNKNLGWAHTVNYPDKIDVFELEMDPSNENRYRLDGEWHELNERTIRLKVKIFPGLRIGVKRKVYWSEYGPTLKTDEGVFAFHMAIMDNIRAPDQWYQMNKASNWDEFREALEIRGIPGFNIVYADKAGNVFYIGNGNIPLRDPRYEWRNIVPGNTFNTIRSEYHPLDDLPQIFKPASGFVYNTNHSAFLSTDSIDHLSESDYDPTMGYRLWQNNRSYRVMELVDREEKFSWEEFLELKYDKKLPDSLCFLVDLNPIMDIDPNLIRHGREVLEIIQKWDRTASVDAIGPAHLMVFYRHLLEKLDLSRYDVHQPLAVEMIESLAYTEKYMNKHFGKLNVSLGEYHFLVRGDKQLPVWGINDVLTAMHDEPMKRGRMRVRAGESHILMIRYPKEGLPIIETVNVYGASDDPDSPHYSDQMEMFVNQELKPMTLDLDKVRKNAVRIYNPK